YDVGYTGLRKDPKTKSRRSSTEHRKSSVMRYRRFVFAILVMGAFAWTSRANATFTTIDAPGAANGTSAAGINAHGQIVGSYSDAAGNNHSFLLDDGTFTTIDFPGAPYTKAVGINDRGQIVGGYLE